MRSAIFSRRALLALGAAAVAAAATRRAGATLTVLSDLDDLAANADVIVIGGVRDLHPSWSGARIVSDVTVDVGDALKGSARGPIVVRVPGGTVGGIGMRVSGVPSFRAGDRAILFLRRASLAADFSFRVYGGTQGKLDIERAVDGRDRVRWVAPSTMRWELVPLADFAERVVRAARRGPR